MSNPKFDALNKLCELLKASHTAGDDNPVKQAISLFGKDTGIITTLIFTIKDEDDETKIITVGGNINGVDFPRVSFTLKLEEGIYSFAPSHMVNPTGLVKLDPKKIVLEIIKHVIGAKIDVAEKSILGN